MVLWVVGGKRRGRKSFRVGLAGRGNGKVCLLQGGNKSKEKQLKRTSEQLPLKLHYLRVKMVSLTTN